MSGWVYDPEINAAFATDRLGWQRAHDWPIFQYSTGDLWVAEWLRALVVSDFDDYAALMPRLSLGLELQPEHRERAEGLKRRRSLRMDFGNYLMPAETSVVAALRMAMDEYFGARGRRSYDGMRAYRWQVDEVEFQVEYRLRYGTSLELELAHASVDRLLPQMVLATPTIMRVGGHEDVEPTVRYVAAWLAEIALMVRFRPGSGGGGRWEHL